LKRRDVSQRDLLGRVLKPEPPTLMINLNGQKKGIGGDRCGSPCRPQERYVRRANRENMGGKL